MKKNLEDKYPLSKLGSNFFWLLADKGFYLIDALIVGALVARYLGPTDVGRLANAMAFVSLFLPLVLFGLDRIVVRNLVQNPTNRSRDFWSVFFVRLVLGLLTTLLLLVLLTSGILGSDDESDFWVLSIISSSLVFYCLHASKLLLESQVNSKWTVWVTNVVLAIFSGVKLLFVGCGGTVVAFALAQLAFLFVNGVCLFVAVARLGLLPKFTIPGLDTILPLVKECWPVAISGVATTLYMNLDISMLKWMIGSREAGVYSIAVMMSTFFYFIPMALQSTYLPKLAEVHAESEKQFLHSFRHYLSINIFVGVICVVSSLLVIPLVIRLLFGAEFEDACQIFRLHIFSLFFVFLGNATSTKLIIQSRHHSLMFVRLLGAGINIATNLILIPDYGSQGAAVATIIAYSMTGFGCFWLVKRLRDLGIDIVWALVNCPAEMGKFIAKLGFFRS